MLDCWVHLDGSPVTTELLRPLVEEDELRGSIVFGEPGAGKTTLLGQLVHTFVGLVPDFRLSPVVLEFNHFHHRATAWPRDDFGTAAVSFLRNTAALPKSRVLFMDIPVPRMRSTLVKVAQRPEAMFLALVSDPRVQEKAIKLRTDLRFGRFGFGEDVSTILERHHVVSDLQNANDVLSVTYGMAPPQAIHWATEETLCEAEQVVRQGRIDPATIDLPPHAVELPEPQRERFRLRIAHVRYYLSEVLGVPEDRHTVLVGTYAADRTVHWFQDEINRHVYE